MKRPLYTQILKKVAGELWDDEISAYSAAASFFIFLSFFPFTMFFLTLLNYLPVDLEGFLNVEIDFLSREVSVFVASVINEIYEKSSGTLISVTTLVALWSASKGFLGIVRGLNSVYSVGENRGFIKLRLVTLFYTVVMIAVLIATLGFLVFGGSINDRLKPYYLDFETILGLNAGMRWVFAVVILALFFMFVYTVVPERKTRFINELPGAAVSALGWIAFSALFSFYIEHFANVRYFYGNLTSIVLLMLWLYSCVSILFFGAKLNCLLQDKRISIILRQWGARFNNKK